MKNFIEKYDNVLPSVICNRLIRIAKENPDLGTPGSTVATRHLGLEETQKVKKTLDWDIKDKIDFKGFVNELVINIHIIIKSNK